MQHEQLPGEEAREAYHPRPLPQQLAAQNCPLPIQDLESPAAAGTHDSNTAYRLKPCFAQVVCRSGSHEAGSAQHRLMPR